MKAKAWIYPGDIVSSTFVAPDPIAVVAVTDARNSIPSIWFRIVVIETNGSIADYDILVDRNRSKWKIRWRQKK